MYRLEFELPGLPPMNTRATRRHWAVQHHEASVWRQAVVWTVGRRRPEAPLRHARVTMTRYAPGGREPDPDNLALSFKPILDALCQTESRVYRGRRRWIRRANVLHDDDPKTIRLKDRIYRWERVPRGNAHISVLVEELEVTDSESNS